MNIIETAIRLAGGQKELATKCGVTQPAVHLWLHGRIPARRVLAVEAATGGQVSRHDLRPDIYPRDHAA